MPQDVVFDLPWPLRKHPGVAGAREHCLGWLAAQGLADRRGLTAETFVTWQLDELAGYFFPRATQEGLELATDLMVWYFAPFDDQFDGALGRDPRRTAGVCAGLAEVLYGVPEPGPVASSPVGRALGDLWRRSCTGMSPFWRTRARHNWTGYLAAHTAESVPRYHGRTVDAAYCVRQRGYANSSHVIMDLIERTGGFEVPAMVWHHPVLVELRTLTSEMIGISNDLCSAEKEEADGDLSNNLLLVLENHEGLDRPEAIERARALTAERVARFLDVERAVTDVDCLLDGAGREAVRRFVEGLHDLVRGDNEWERTTGRYQPAISGLQDLADLMSSGWDPLASGTAAGHGGHTR
uniref:Cucumene Synthase n=1 Tax=Streptomyces clavuligerus TaxID=1901 RepID=UPI000EFA3045|nr:Chain A, Cucumene Synthase [Streptomyces clavuligerus]6EGK_B Chain B, Cucumene Synthase [Streptomyces clavuligerus]